MLGTNIFWGSIFWGRNILARAIDRRLDTEAFLLLLKFAFLFIKDLKGREILKVGRFRKKDLRQIYGTFCPCWILLLEFGTKTLDWDLASGLSKFPFPFLDLTLGIWDLDFDLDLASGLSIKFNLISFNCWSFSEWRQEGVKVS